MTIKRTTGIYEKIGHLDYFIPDPLPPQNPSLNLDNQTLELYGQTMYYLGKLNEMASRVPNVQRFIKAYVIKEALLSSAIEGIHTTIIDVFTQPIIETKPSKETQLVLNYTTALDTALSMMQKDGFPVVNRVILAAHEVLMRGGEGEKASPGQYRKQTVRVGNLTPAPAQKIPILMTDLENFINTDISLPPLIKAGLAHVQFETIHPFLDGNGRIGRLLIVLILIDNNLLQVPILYPSYYFKKYHAEYYQKLDGIRKNGDFESWIYYYLKAIRYSSSDAYNRILDIEILEQKIHHSIINNSLFAKNTDQVLNILNIFFQTPIMSINKIAEQLDKSYNTIARIIEQFVSLNIVQEITDKKRNKLFMFSDYLNLLEKEYPED